MDMRLEQTEVKPYQGLQYRYRTLKDGEGEWTEWEWLAYARLFFGTNGEVELRWAVIPDPPFFTRNS